MSLADMRVFGTTMQSLSFDKVASIIDRIEDQVREIEGEGIEFHKEEPTLFGETIPHMSDPTPLRLKRLCIARSLVRKAQLLCQQVLMEI